MLTGGDHPREVVWRNLPTDAFLASLRHLEDLAHEPRVLHAAGRGGAVVVPAELAAATKEILHAYETPQQGGCS